MPSIFEIFMLLLVSAAAGAINSIAGGGTILTFPTLLAFGMPAIQANATSTFALLTGIIGSVYSYRTHLPAAKQWLYRFTPVSISGGIIGAWLLTRTSETVFSHLVPFLLLFATILFLANNAFRRLAGLESIATERAPPTAIILSAIALQFGVAIYGGYFGAGIGILMLATLGFMGLRHIHEMNAIKTILSAMINVVATIYFIFVGIVVWPQAIIMTIGAIVGYYTGAAFAQKLPQSKVRALVVVIGLGISTYLLLKQFLLKHL